MPSPMVTQRATILALFVAFVPHMAAALSTVSMPTSSSSSSSIPVVTPSPDAVVTTDTTEHVLDLSMVIGTQDGGSRMSVRGMNLAMQQDHIDVTSPLISMPSSHGGLNKKYSHGLKRLKVVQDGSFIGMNGQTKVSPHEEGCWEMIWKDGSPAGSIVCGLRLPESYSRNDAVLPHGDLCVTFPVFSKEGLVFGRQRKQELQAKSAEHKANLDAAMERVQNARNPFVKMMHYRDAVEFAEKYRLHITPLEQVKTIPDTDKDILKLNDDLFLMAEGHVWHNSALGFHPDSVLGSASISFAAEG